MDFTCIRAPLCGCSVPTLATFSVQRFILMCVNNFYIIMKLWSCCTAAQRTSTVVPADRWSHRRTIASRCWNLDGRRRRRRRRWNRRGGGTPRRPQTSRKQAARLSVCAASARRAYSRQTRRCRRVVFVRSYMKLGGAHAMSCGLAASSCHVSTKVARRTDFTGWINVVPLSSVRSESV